MKISALVMFAATVISTSSFAQQTKVGFIATLSGPRASIGRDALDAARMAVEEIGEKSGTVPFELVVEDSGGIPRQGVDAYKKLLSQGIRFILTQNSNISLPVSLLVNKDRVLQLAHATTLDSYSRAYDLTFRINGGTSDEARVMAAFIAGNLKRTSGALAILSMEDEYPLSLAKSLAIEFEKLGIEPALYENFSPGTTDFRALITRLKGSGVKYLALLSYQTEAGLFIKQQAELGLHPEMIITDTPVNNKEFFVSAGSSAEGTLLTYIKVDTTYPASFRYQALYGRPASFFAANSYDAVMIANQALQSCSYQAEPECLRQNMPRIKNYKGMGGTRSFDDKYGDMRDEYEVLIAKDGRFVSVNNGE